MSLLGSVDESKMRVFDRVGQGGISVVFDMTGAACHQGAIGLPTSVHPQLRWMQRYHLADTRYLPHPLPNKPLGILVCPRQDPDTVGIVIMAKTENIDPVWDDLDR
jgi:hypothetical protein